MREISVLSSEPSPRSETAEKSLELDDINELPKVNHKHLLLVTASAFLSSMQYGGVLSASAQNFSSLNVQLEWTEVEKLQNITYLSFICILGMALGCITAGKLFKYGKRKVVMIF